MLNITEFFALAKCNVNSGDTLKFWKDSWSAGSMKEQLPHLFSFALNQDISVQMAVNYDTVEDLFLLPLSEEAYQELGTFQELVHSVNLTNAKDEWVYSWGKDYSVSKAYKFF